MKCDWTAGGLWDEGAGCLRDVAGVEGEGGGYVPVVWEEAVVDDWPGHGGGGGGCCLALVSAHMQGVHGGGRSPGCRSSPPLLLSHLLHLCLPIEVGDDDPGGMGHGGPTSGQHEEDPGLGEAQEKNVWVPGLALGPAFLQVVWAWPYGLQGST